MSAIYGLTGTPCSGKTTVLKLCKSKGFKILNSDAIVKNLLRPGASGYKKVVSVFGKKLTDKRGFIIRKRLRALALEKKENLRKLENILHPEVRKTIEERKKKLSNSKMIVEVPLLFETGLYKTMDASICIVASVANQRKYALKRKWPIELLKKLAERQWDVKRKIKKSDFVIRNDGTLSDLKMKISKVLNEIKKGR